MRCRIHSMDGQISRGETKQTGKQAKAIQAIQETAQNRREPGEATQERLKNKLKPAEELNTEELMSHMRCELVDIEEAVDMYNLNVEECRAT